MIQAWISEPLGLESGWICHHTACRKGFAINNCHHAIEANASADLRPIQGCNQWFGQGQATGFHHDPIQAFCSLKQLLHSWQEVVLDRAAEAAICQLHQAGVQLIFGAKTTAA